MKRFVRRVSWLVVCLALTLAFNLCALAQATGTAQLRGEIRDASGAVVPGATVTVTNDATKAASSEVTGSAGRYIFNYLQPAQYSLHVSAQGFRAATRQAVVLRVGQQSDIDFSLQVGEVSSSVDVTAAAPLLNSVSAALSQEVDNRYVTEVPLFNRDPSSLAYLTPGILYANGNRTTGVNFVSNGQRVSTAEMRLDGISVTAPETSEGNNSTLKFSPPIEGIQEFQVQNNGLSAEYGNNGGTVISMITKAGSNHLHGSGYWFGRRPAMDATPFFTNRAGGSIADFTHDQWGGAIGGPIRRNRTFFFFDLDRVRDNSPQHMINTVPSALERAGNFSQTFNADKSLQTIYNPNDVFKDTDGVMKRRPFPGNVIPQSLFDPIAAKLLTYYPNPTGSGDPVTHLNNFNADGIQHSPVTAWDARIDHILTDAQRLSGRYSLLRGQTQTPYYYNNPAENATRTDTHGQNGYLEHSWTLNPNTVWTNRGGVTRLYRNMAPPAFDLTSLGFSKQLTAGGMNQFPSINAAGYANLGVEPYSNLLDAVTQYQWSSVLSKVKGAHNLKAGAEQKIALVNYFSPGAVTGYFPFDNGASAQTVFSPLPSQGNGLASMLLGWGAEGGGIDIIPGTANKAKESAFYFQDDWRVSSKLTLNLGLRYEWSSPYTERYNRLQIVDPNFDSGVTIPGLGRIKGAAIPVTSSNRTVSPDRNNFAPRLGAAYRIGTNTVLRGGAGAYYGTSAYTNSNILAQGFTSSTYWEPSRDGGLTRFATLSNPFPAGMVLPVDQKYGKLSGWGYYMNSAMDYEVHNPEIYQWNFGVQHAITPTLLVDAAYSGSRSIHLLAFSSENFNVVSAADRLKYGKAGLNQMVPNPFQSMFAGPNAVFNEPASMYSDSKLPLGNLLRPYPQFDAGLAGNQRPIATARYNGLHVRFEKRYSHGLNFVGAYTMSRSTDSAGSGRNRRFGNAVRPQDLNDLSHEYGLSGSDTPQRLILGWSYELPIGRGKALGKSWNRPLSAVLGDWQLNGLTTFQSGMPLNIALAGADLYDGWQRPNVVGSPRTQFSIKDTVDKLGTYLDPAGFSRPASQVPGNAPRYLADARGSGIRNIDLSLFKVVHFTEAAKLELRGEFFNFTNTPRFSDPNTSFGNRAFGTITGQRNNARQVQVGARFQF